MSRINLTIWKDDEQTRDIVAWIRGMERQHPGMLFVQLQALYECHFAQSPNDSGTFCGEEDCSLCVPPKKEIVRGLTQ